MSPNGRELLLPRALRRRAPEVFTSYRPVPGDTASKPSAGLWYADRMASGWASPVFIDSAADRGLYHSQPSFGPGDSVYFHRSSADRKTTRSMVTGWNGKAYGSPRVPSGLTAGGAQGRAVIPIERICGTPITRIPSGGCSTAQQIDETISGRVTNPRRRTPSLAAGIFDITAYSGVRSHGHRWPGPSTYQGRSMVAAKPLAAISDSHSRRTAI